MFLSAFLLFLVFVIVFPSRASVAKNESSFGVQIRGFYGFCTNELLRGLSVEYTSFGLVNYSPQKKAHRS